MTDRTITTVNPATETELARYERMNDDQMFEALKACHDAFDEWRLTPATRRAEIIARIGQQLSSRKEELAQLMTDEVGKLIGDSRDEVDLCAAICEWTAKQGPEVLADEHRSLQDGRQGIITYSPVGVIYGIQPWNFPAYQAVRYSIANLMAGNGVLLKHAANCTGSGLLLREIYESAGLPKNLFTVMTIDHDQSDKLIAHELVRGVTMTGSASGGSIIAKTAGEHLKKTVLELGSNDAYLVLEDADLDLAVKTCVAGRIYNNGETCVNAKRFIVTDAVYDAFVERYVDAMSKVVAGNPNDEETGLGPMARGDLRDTLHQQVRDSVDKGARIACGGSLPGGQGYYYPATVLTDVKPGQPAYDEELFGPVASVIRAEDDEDAMRIANDSRFGLGGGIFSKDEARATELARTHFDTGMVFINHFNLATPEMPFGGVKDSGYGREHGGFGMREFVNAKAIAIAA
ncbi:MAG: succinate-semialdehyde dehydrogenase [Rhodobacteraceae bacterium]|jgi:succinate-semialdehyde dehydrogenase/glutarate-semialdehyde dehydrogenase|uniref:Succinate-semialdehyde dehydrogenase / glutarate-semialdehyde dehydrogenase n=1 Tax=Salipiger profundus TaxID=1229727 RepID=A0A1U7D7J3_9RHOB|nr:MULTISPECIES: NAD-dependent succinate-semialdehyde dehydrogenase [Salipiger]APX24082.1 succinate-semialdehyde dehydrogenase / glutarate-semialdehyde dehydrogenase [Salipiger profundus]MAB06873.1 succinate-semialdehyde dehydrogenase [Paracoccaceae bacterium]GFZ94532.1 succinate-semialdehyde dehydrogenase [Salipiger profundus]SFB91688.1 succinate-semialdehyde dehydrogenase / glutarate-semialdehyde dehydrogenase [Salipiger profundus]